MRRYGLATSSVQAPHRRGHIRRAGRPGLRSEHASESSGRRRRQLAQEVDRVALVAGAAAPDRVAVDQDERARRSPQELAPERDDRRRGVVPARAAPGRRPRLRERAQDALGDRLGAGGIEVGRVLAGELAQGRDVRSRPRGSRSPAPRRPAARSPPRGSAGRAPRRARRGRAARCRRRGRTRRRPRSSRRARRPSRRRPRARGARGARRGARA